MGRCSPCQSFGSDELRLIKTLFDWFGQSHVISDDITAAVPDWKVY